MENAHKFYIDGAWVAPASDETLAVINPATEDEMGTIAVGNEADVDRAVAAAKAAFESFQFSTVDERRALLARILEIYKTRAEDIGKAVSLELGAPVDFAISDQAGAGTWHLQGILNALDEVKFDSHLPNGDRVLREPIGVVGAITPWNWPLNQIALKVFAAIAAGCTVVLKPSEITPYNAIIFAEIMDAAKVPVGVFNMVHGLGPVVGAAMSRHKDIDMMSFTGSTRAGALVTQDSAPSVKRVALELGGKSPNIVFADCDVEKAVTNGAVHMFENTGQSCNAPSRMLVERSVYEQAVEIAKNVAENTKVGRPDESGDFIGPVVSEVQFNKIQGLIEAGISGGARLVAGGVGRPEGFNRGYFVRPTVFADVTDDMEIWREEIFGPVLAMSPFDSEDEAVRMANDTDYGLAAYVQTGDAARAERVGRQLRAGMVRVNGAGLACGSPFGGYKQSGNGREGGAFGIEDFLEVKLYAVPKGFA